MRSGLSSEVGPKVRVGCSNQCKAHAQFVSSRLTAMLRLCREIHATSAFDSARSSYCLSSLIPKCSDLVARFPCQTSSFIRAYPCVAAFISVHINHAPCPFVVRSASSVTIYPRALKRIVSCMMQSNLLTRSVHIIFLVFIPVLSLIIVETCIVSKATEHGTKRSR